MVARVKSTRFGCMLVASLLVLVLAGCADVSESSSSQKAQPSKKGTPTETAEATLLEVARQLQTHPTRHARTFLRARRPCEPASAAGMYSPGPCWPPRSASRSPMPGSSSGWPTLGGTTTMHTGLRCLLARGKVSLREQRARLLRRQATPHPR